MDGDQIAVDGGLTPESGSIEPLPPEAIA